MKRTIVGLILLSLFADYTNCYSQSGKNLDAGYYIIVSAYSPAKESVARRYVKELRAAGYEADFGMDTRPHLYLVYINYYDDFRVAIRQMLQTRKAGRFTDAWVRVITGDIQQKVPEKPKEETAPAPVTPVHKGEQQVSERQKTPEIEKEDTPEVEPEEESIHSAQAGQKIFINLFYVTKNRIVDGYVTIIDTERKKVLKKVKGNGFVFIADPKTSSGQVTLIADVFGYRKMEHDLTFPLTKKNTADLPFVEWVEGVPAISFELDRYHKGDVAVMYNVYFYNDASIMLPKSKYELGSLLQLLQENTHYRIRLHGHTNGNRTGKIIALGPDKSFFAVTDESLRTMGTAKKLSGMRADTIREYLIEQGIDPGRIETKAWGGKRPLYEPNSPSARKNVRVEVEILAE